MKKDILISMVYESAKSGKITASKDVIIKKILESANIGDFKTYFIQ